MKRKRYSVEQIVAAVKQHEMGTPVSDIARKLGIAEQTFYRWKHRAYDPYHLESLEDHSHCPKHLHQPIWSIELIQEVLRLREQYPRWGKDKIVILLREQGW